MFLAVFQTRGFETVILEHFCLFSLDGEPHPLKCLVLLETIVGLICKLFCRPIQARLLALSGPGGGRGRGSLLLR